MCNSLYWYISWGIKTVYCPAVLERLSLWLYLKLEGTCLHSWLHSHDHAELLFCWQGNKVEFSCRRRSSGWCNTGPSARHWMPPSPSFLSALHSFTFVLFYSSSSSSSGSNLLISVTPRKKKKKQHEFSWVYESPKKQLGVSVGLCEDWIFFNSLILSSIIMYLIHTYIT